VDNIKLFVWSRVSEDAVLDRIVRGLNEVVNERASGAASLCLFASEHWKGLVFHNDNKPEKS
jgi:ribosomal protein L7Ae-like RNA K-turn-binding protein